MGAGVEAGEVERVFAEARADLVRIAFLMTGSIEDAEDCVQVAFGSLHQHRASVRDPLAYLRRAVTNRAADGHRRSFRIRPLPPPQPTEIPEIDETFAHVLALNGDQRAVVVLHFYADMTLADIAGLLDRNPATVRSDLRRALEILRRALP